VLHHLVRRRIRLRPSTIRNMGMFRSSSNIKTRDAFMLPVTLENVVYDVVSNEVGSALHLDERRREAWREPIRDQQNNPSPYIRGLAKLYPHWLSLFYPAKP
jgi:hypothetical protein